MYVVTTNYVVFIHVCVGSAYLVRVEIEVGGARSEQTLNLLRRSEYCIPLLNSLYLQRR